AEVTEEAPAEAGGGDVAELLLDGLDGGAGAALDGERERDGVDGGEPADRAAEVDVFEGDVATVALEVDADRRGARPDGEGLRERGEQEVVDAGAVGVGRVAEEALRLLGGERDEDGAGRGLGGVAAAMVDGERRDEGLCGGEPVRELGGDGAGAGGLGEALGPALERRGLGRKLGGDAAALLRVRGPEVVEQDAPGDSVYGDMVRDEEAAAAALSEVEEHDAGDGALGEVEARVGALRGVLDGGRACLGGHGGEVDALEGRRAAWRCDGLRVAGGQAGEAEAE